jgi:hypothetical protein
MSARLVWGGHPASRKVHLLFLALSWLALGGTPAAAGFCKLPTAPQPGASGNAAGAAVETVGSATGDSLKLVVGQAQVAMALADVVGWEVPIFGALEVLDVEDGEDYCACTVKDGEVATQVVAFVSEGKRPAVAVLIKGENSEDTLRDAGGEPVVRMGGGALVLTPPFTHKTEGMLSSSPKTSLPLPVLKFLGKEKERDFKVRLPGDVNLVGFVEILSDGGQAFIDTLGQFLRKDDLGYSIFASAGLELDWIKMGQKGFYKTKAKVKKEDTRTDQQKFKWYDFFKAITFISPAGRVPVRDGLAMFGNNQVDLVFKVVKDTSNDLKKGTSQADLTFSIGALTSATVEIDGRSVQFDGEIFSGVGVTQKGRDPEEDDPTPQGRPRSDATAAAQKDEILAAVDEADSGGAQGTDSPSGTQDQKTAKMKKKGLKADLGLTFAGQARNAVWRRAFGIPRVTAKKLGLQVMLNSTLPLPGFLRRKLKSEKVTGFLIDGQLDIGPKVRDLRFVGSFFKIHGQRAYVRVYATPKRPLDLLDIIPGASNLLGESPVKLTELVLSNDCVGGRLVTDSPYLNNLAAYVFEADGGWNMAVMRENFTLADVFPLPEPAKKTVEPLRLKKAAFIFSQRGIDKRTSQLPISAQMLISDIYGDVDTRLKILDGINLLAVLDPEGINPALKEMSAGISKGNLVLAGSLGGLLGGPPSVQLAAAIPPVTLPKGLEFIVLPKNVTTSFFVGIEGLTLAKVGISVAAVMGVKDQNGRPVDFETAIDFQADTRGGLSVVLDGTSLSPWGDAFAIKGFTLDEGTRIELAGSLVTTELGMTIVGRSKIGEREVQLVGSTTILLSAGTPTGAAFQGKVNFLSTDDLVALTNAAVVAGGNEPLEPDFPELKLTDVDVAFASPGVNVPEIGLMGGGTRLKGKLWFLVPDGPLGEVLAEISTNGLELYGDVADFRYAGVEVKDARLDSKALLMPPNPPYFSIKGKTSIFGAEAQGKVSATLNQSEVAAAIDMGDLLQFDFRAYGGVPKLTIKKSELAKFDLLLNTHLRSDIPRWLRTDGKKPVEAAFATLGATFAQAKKDLEVAQAEVARLEGEIARAKVEAQKSRQDRASALKAAQARIDAFDADIRKADKDIRSTKAGFKKCTYKKKRCVVRNPVNRKCLKKVKVPDLKRNAACAANNTRLGTKLTRLESTRAGLVTSRKAALPGLEALKKGNAAAPIELHPLVAPLIASRETAMLTLEAAERANEGAAQVNEDIRKAVTMFAEYDGFALDSALVEGSFQKALRGKPAIAGFSFRAFGQKYGETIAYSFTDPTFNPPQLDLIALSVANVVLREAAKQKKVSPVVAAQINQAYLDKRNQVDELLAPLKKEHGLD